MPVKAIQHLSDVTVGDLSLPATVIATPNAAMVTGIKPQGTTWPADDTVSPFTVVDREITAAEESDLLLRLKAIDRTDPTGALLAVHVDDQIDTRAGPPPPI